MEKQAITGINSKKKGPDSAVLVHILI